MRIARSRYVWTVPLLALAVVSFVFVREKQGEGQVLIRRQHQAQALTPAAVSRVVRAAPDPVTHLPGTSASCRSLGAGALRNPWSCLIRYRSSRLIRYRVTISAGGSYFGDHEVVAYQGQRYTDTGTIHGCCVAVP